MRVCVSGDSSDSQTNPTHCIAELSATSTSCRVYNAPSGLLLFSNPAAPTLYWGVKCLNLIQSCTVLIGVTGQCTTPPSSTVTVPSGTNANRWSGPSCSGSQVVSLTAADNTCIQATLNSQPIQESVKFQCTDDGGYIGSYWNSNSGCSGAATSQFYGLGDNRCHSFSDGQAGSYQVDCAAIKAASDSAKALTTTIVTIIAVCVSVGGLAIIFGLVYCLCCRSRPVQVAQVMVVPTKSPMTPITVP